jgi:hypothetical protein
MTMKRTEQVIHRAVVDHLKIRGWPGIFYFHAANGGYRKPSEAKIFAGLAVIPGVPDLIIIKDGEIFAVELKSENGRLSTAQRTCHEAMRAAGAVVEVAMGLDAALALLERWQILRGTSWLRSPGLSTAVMTGGLAQ